MEYVHRLIAVAGEVPKEISDDHDQIIIALIAIIATSIGALVYTIKNNNINKGLVEQGRGIAEDAAKANAAVNNVGPGEHRLYDIIARIEEKQDKFERKWSNLPEEMDDAVGLAMLLHDVRNDIKQIQAQLLEHVTWEMAQKYPSVGQLRDVQTDVSMLLEHDRTRDVEGKRYESGEG